MVSASGEGNWQSLPWGSQTHICGLASSALYHPLTHFRLLSYARNVLKSFIYKRPSFPVSSLLQIYCFPHANTGIIVESLATRPTDTLLSGRLTPVMSSTPGGRFWKWISLLKVDSSLIYILLLNIRILETRIESCLERKQNRGRKEGGRERGKEEGKEGRKERGRIKRKQANERDVDKTQGPNHLFNISHKQLK